MDIHQLKKVTERIKPIMDANLNEAYKEYLQGDLSAGAFCYCRNRHENMLTILSDESIDPVLAFKIGTMFAIDLRSGIEEMKNKAEAQEAVDAWWQCYRDNGFSDVDEIFKTPQQPKFKKE